MNNLVLPLLPPVTELETKTVLKKCSQANRYLAELTAAGLLRKEKIGVSHFFVNEPLYTIFTQRKS
jgi:hypothetical protein